MCLKKGVLAMGNDQKAAIQEALSFGKNSDLPAKNLQLIQWLVDQYLRPGSTESHKMSFDVNTMKWLGEAYVQVDPDDLTGECKYWVQQDVIKSVFNITIPPNDTSNDDQESDYKWDESQKVIVIAQSLELGQLDEAISNPSAVRAGDIIQYTGGVNGQHTVIIGSVTEQGIWVFDSNAVSNLSPAYHFISYGTLSSVDRFTIYRLA